MRNRALSAESEKRQMRGTGLGLFSVCRIELGQLASLSPSKMHRAGRLMKTGTGSAISCAYATAQPLLVAVPVPPFSSAQNEN